MSRLRIRVLVLALSLPLVAYAILGGFLGRALARESTYRYLSVFQDVLTLVTSSYVEPVNMENVMEGAIRGMMEALDPDSCYLTPKEFAEFQKTPTARRGEIGVEVTKRYYIQVVSVLPGSTAEHAGLQPGDLLKAIDGLNTRDVNVIVGERLLQGAPGTKTKLQVLRGRSPDPVEYEIARAAAPESTVTSKKLDDTAVGYVRITSFRPGVAGGVARAVKALTSSGATQIVLDVRDSYGRFGEEGIHVAELFVAGGVAATLSGRDQQKSELKLAADRVVFKGPMVVLLNGSSSGAAELMASAFKAGSRAELVGEKTAGRTAVQRVVSLGDGAGLVLSVSQYTTADGKPLLGNGIQPTVEVDRKELRDGSSSEDVILKKGLDVLKSAGVSKVAA